MDLFGRVDLWVIFLYMVGMIAVAFWVSDRSRDAEGYTVAHRNMSGLVLGLSVLGTFTSSITFLGLPTNTYKGNWSAFNFGLALPVAALIATRYFVPLYRRGVSLSAYEYMERRFGYWARAYADMCFIVLQLIRAATVMLLVALATAPLLGMDIVPMLCVFGVVVILYDTVGGITADIWTDVIQVFILVGGALWCLAELVFRYPGGASEFVAEIPLEKLSLGDLASWDLGQTTVLVIFLYGISENLRNYGTDQSYIQRFLSAQDERAAAKSIWIGALSYVPLSVVFCLIGTGLYMRYDLGGAALPEGILANQVFPHFIRYEVPQVVTGLIISAILAAAMSTVDSNLNSMSTVLLVDVVQRLAGSRLLPFRDITILRASTVAFGVIATGTSVLIYRIFLQQSGTIMDLWWQYAGTVGGGLFGLFLLGWLMPRIPSAVAGLAVLATIPVLYWGTFMRTEESANLQCRLHPNLVGIAGTLTMLSIGVVGLALVRAGVLRPNPRSHHGAELATTGQE